MARAYMHHYAPGQGQLVLEELFPNCLDVFYVPPEEKLIQSGIDPDEAEAHRVRLLRMNAHEGFLTIFPTNTLGGHDRFLEPKYGQIERITLDDFDYLDPDFDSAAPETPEEVAELLEALPSGFTKDYEYGLGLAKDYLPIIYAVEELSNCTEIIISRSHPTGIDEGNKVFYLAAAEFEKARKALNNITNLGRTAARSVKQATAYNILAEKLDRALRPVKAGRHPLRKIITAVAQGEEPLADDEQDTVLNLLTRNAQSVAEAKPEKLAKIQSDIELVTLELLIDRYEEMMGKKLNESRWQTFFNENPFILNMAFGYPVIKVQDQASIGGRKLSGGGEKITDFLVKNRLTNNTAIFEIKTPQTPLLHKTPFRDGVYTPSADLSGSINQALDQKYQFQSHAAQIKVDTRIYDIESYSVHCSLIIGTIPTGHDQLKSFELFRRNSKDVEIVSFDELLEKLKQLCAFLKAES